MLFIINNMTFNVNYSYVRLMLHRLQHRLPGENAKKHLLNVVFQLEHPSLEEIYWRLDSYIEYVLSFRHPQEKVLLWENFYRDYYRDHLNPYYGHRSSWTAEFYDAVMGQRERDINKLSQLWEEWYIKFKGYKPFYRVTYGCYPKSIIKEFRNSLNKNNRFLFDSIICKKEWK